MAEANGTDPVHVQRHVERQPREKGKPLLAEALGNPQAALNPDLAVVRSDVVEHAVRVATDEMDACAESPQALQRLHRERA